MPYQTLRLPVGRGLSIEFISKAIAEHPELHRFLIGDVSQHDPRAEYTWGSFQVQSVERGEGRGAYVVEYSYDWSSYYGCRDMNKSDTEYETFGFRYWNRELIFRKAVVEPRTTVEEF